MEDNILAKMQNDLKQSNPIILNNNDNISKIQKKFSNKYTEDVSDSDDDLSSYRKRNSNIINQVDKSKQKVNKSNLNKVNKAKKENSEDEKNSRDDKNSEDESEKNNKKNNNSDDSDNSDNSEVEYEYSQEFKDKVKTYVKNDDKIRELQQEIKKLNVIKKTAEMDILKHLERLGENNINITGGKLRINQYESKDSLKETIIKEAITEKIKDPKIMENIIEIINEKRINNAKIQVSLKRTFERGKK
jgi:soluble cytochrome b562